MGLTAEAYCDVFDRLERDRVRYVVVGGVAVVLRGHVRPVADLDLAVDPAPGETLRALRALGGLGFVSTIPLPLGVATVLRMFDRSAREVNVFVRGHVPFGELWPGSGRVSVAGGVARVASLEHLLRAKRINGRAHDLLDVEALLAREAAGRGRG